MAIQISILGLGQIGASVGLALNGRKDAITRVGFDRKAQVMREAIRLEAVDRTENNPHKAVRNADVVLLALPVDQIQETLTLIVNDLKAGAVILDTCPIKAAVANWARELLPRERHYVGLTPVINPDYLISTETGIQAARADLFQNGMMAIAASSHANGEAIKLAADLAKTLGAMPFFADPVEIDGLMAATHLLPQLIAAALINATVHQPGWREGRKFAGRSFAESTAPVVRLEETGNLLKSVIVNKENVGRVIDNLLIELRDIRNEINGEDETALSERLEQARQGGETWWKERHSGDWLRQEVPGMAIPDSGGFFGRLFGTGLKSGQKKK